MITLFITILVGTLVCYCDGLPASVSEAQSAASQQVHLYLKNSTEAVDSQLVPIISEVRNTNEQIEDEREAVIPFLSFLFDTLGTIGDEIENCLDDMIIQLIPDDPDDPGFVAVPVEAEPDETPKSIITNDPVILPDAIKSNITTK